MNECLVTFITSAELEENSSSDMAGFWRELICPTCGDHWLTPEAQRFAKCKKCGAEIVAYNFYAWLRDTPSGISDLNVVAFHSGVLRTQITPKPFFPRKWTDPKPYFPKRWLSFDRVIRERAFDVWNKAGQPYHNGVEFWLEAKWDLLKECL